MLAKAIFFLPGEPVHSNVGGWSFCYNGQTAGDANKFGWLELLGPENVLPNLQKGSLDGKLLVCLEPTANRMKEVDALFFY